MHKNFGTKKAILNSHVKHFNWRNKFDLISMRYLLIMVHEAKFDMPSYIVETHIRYFSVLNQVTGIMY